MFVPAAVGSVHADRVQVTGGRQIVVARHRPRGDRLLQAGGLDSRDHVAIRHRAGAGRRRGDAGQRIRRRRERRHRRAPVGRPVAAKLGWRIGRMHQRQHVRALHVVDVEKVRGRIRIRDLVDVRARRHRIPIRRVGRRVAGRGRDAVVVHTTGRAHRADRVSRRAVVGRRRRVRQGRRVGMEAEVAGAQLDRERLRIVVAEGDQPRRAGGILHFAHELGARPVDRRAVRQRDEVSAEREPLLPFLQIDAAK